jgi:hypothetical protein
MGIRSLDDLLVSVSYRDEVAIFAINAINGVMHWSQLVTELGKGGYRGPARYATKNNATTLSPHSEAVNKVTTAQRMNLWCRALLAIALLAPLASFSQDTPELASKVGSYTLSSLG